jgi:glycosyltransferase involved in cell wall biosynthesis
LISAVVPVFNAEKTLIRAVDSLLLQQEIDEIFLVEDGSQDSSLLLCQSLAEKYPIVKVLQHPGGVNKGAPGSRNLGLSFAKNEWIQFMDADDQLLPGKISSQILLISESVDVIVGEFREIDESGNSSVIKPTKDVWSGLLSTRLGKTTANLWRKSAMIHAGGWNESLINIQEYYLIFELLMRGSQVRFSDEVGSIIYYLPDSITNSLVSLNEKRDNYFLYREKIRKFLIENKLYNLQRRHNFNCNNGLMLKYHKPSFEVNLDKVYFSIYSSLRYLKQHSKMLIFGFSGGMILLFILFILRKFIDV